MHKFDAQYDPLFRLCVTHSITRFSWAIESYIQDNAPFCYFSANPFRKVIPAPGKQDSHAPCEITRMFSTQENGGW